jgi:hypothetical protein
VPAVAARESMRNPWAASARAGRFFFESAWIADLGDVHSFVASRDNPHGFFSEGFSAALLASSSLRHRATSSGLLVTS